MFSTEGLHQLDVHRFIAVGCKHTKMGLAPEMQNPTEVKIQAQIHYTCTLHEQHTHWQTKLIQFDEAELSYIYSLKSSAETPSVQLPFKSTKFFRGANLPHLVAKTKTCPLAVTWTTNYYSRSLLLAQTLVFCNTGKIQIVQGIHTRPDLLPTSFHWIQLAGLLYTKVYWLT